MKTVSVWLTVIAASVCARSQPAPHNPYRLVKAANAVVNKITALHWALV